MSPAVFLSLETVLRLWHCGTMAMEELSDAGSTGLCVKEAGLRAPFHLSGGQEMSQATGRHHWHPLGESCVDAQPPATNPQFLLLSPTVICVTLRGKK